MNAISPIALFADVATKLQNACAAGLHTAPEQEIEAHAAAEALGARIWTVRPTQDDLENIFSTLGGKLKQAFASALHDELQYTRIVDPAVADTLRPVVMRHLLVS